MKNKNIYMLKSFFKVMSGDNKETKLVIPDMYTKDIQSIDYHYLKKQKLTNLIFDIDNTILKVNDIQVPDDIKTFFGTLEKDGFNICILSNNDKERVLPVAYALQTGYLFKAGKPFPEAFDKALIALNSKKENTAMIGDQMLTDIKGANEYGLYSILVDPVSNQYDLKTGTSRILQNQMIKKLSKKRKFAHGQYYIKERKL